MLNLLYYREMQGPIEGDKSKPKDINDEKWKLKNR